MLEVNNLKVRTHSWCGFDIVIKLTLYILHAMSQLFMVMLTG
jgi:hypothetical protein